MIDEGQSAPKFTLNDQHGDRVSLASLRGKKVVLYFYPKDDTPGCTKEACAFRDATAEFAKAGAVVIGVSPDTVKSHAKFSQKYELPFTLLADPDHAVCESYGVWKEKSMYGRTYMGVERTTVVIDGKGKIRKIFPKVRVNDHDRAVLEAVREL